MQLIIGGVCVTVSEQLVPVEFVEFDSSKEIDRALYSDEEADQIETAETRAVS